MLVNLKDILSGVDETGLISLEQLSKEFSATPLLNGSCSVNSMPFAWKFFTGSDYLMEAARCLEGQIVSDLGAGPNVDGYLLSKVCGARAYIAVDHFNIKSLYRRLLNPTEILGDAQMLGMMKKMVPFLETVPTYNSELVNRLKNSLLQHLSGDLPNIPVALVSEDILTFLKRVPSSSTSVLASGIDRCMIGDDLYASEIEKELARVVSDSGVYFGMCSRFSPSGLIRDAGASDTTFNKFTR